MSLPESRAFLHVQVIQNGIRHLTAIGRLPAGHVDLGNSTRIGDGGLADWHG
ncbi:MAG TPA: hypothetical protein VG077_00070 [Verrucomicrobiae bacterium]|nr:hypothetical protein [Verrucomicrobiae bacterium]